MNPVERFWAVSDKDIYTLDELYAYGLHDGVIDNFCSSKYFTVECGKYKLTSLGKKIRAMFQYNRTWYNAIADWFYKHILHFRVSLMEKN